MDERVTLLLERLVRGEPVLVDSLTFGVQHAAFVSRLREDSARVELEHRTAIELGAGIVRARTDWTTPQALDELGIGFRSAALTGLAIEAARNAADLVPNVCVAALIEPGRSVEHGVPALVAGDVRAELAAHVERIAVAGADLLWATRVAHEEDIEALASAAKVARLPLVVGLSRTLGDAALRMGVGIAVQHGVAAVIAECEVAEDLGRVADVMAGYAAMPWGVALARTLARNVMTARARGASIFAFDAGCADELPAARDALGLPTPARHAPSRARSLRPTRRARAE